MQQTNHKGNAPLSLLTPSLKLKNCLSIIPLDCTSRPFSSPTFVQKEPINIAMGFDAAYAVHSLTTLASIFGTSKTPENLEIYLLHAEIFSPELKQKFFDLAPSPQQIHFLLIDEALFKKLPIVQEHITLPTYYRLLLPDLIAQSKILWIDGDTIVCEDIAHLYHENLDGFLLGASPDITEKDEKKRLAQFYHLSEKIPAESYINAGISLFNLDKIREDYPNLLQSCQDFIEKHPNVIQLEDQDLLNLLFLGRIKRLALKWNLAAPIFYCDRNANDFTDEMLLEAISRPGIIHYTCAWNKPWKTKVRTRFKGLYWYWRRKAGLPPQGIKERLAEILSPCYYLEKNGRNFLRTAFFLLPWMKLLSSENKAHIGKWQGIFPVQNKKDIKNENNHV
ncbi:glycosyltransferase family 8 protein [Acetobacteraceae bacterium]|nr:glycosyltransferase family 8 protein [Acetobacteraceae bacterium]